MIAALSLLVWLLGLCIGSFLNVVIYRLPNDLRVWKPTWSFCPHCRTQLAPRDNVPVLSWLLLRARCRTCRAAISPQYPLVEAVTGLAFVLVFRLLFVTQAHAGVAVAELGRDWPLLLAWLALVAAMTASSVMDIVSYLIDVGVTNTAVVAGLLFMAIWPREEVIVPVATSALAAATTAMFVVSCARLWFDRTAAPSGPVETAPQPAAAKPADAGSFGAAALSATALIAGGLWCALAPTSGGEAWRDPAIVAALLGIFFAMVLASGQTREADQTLHAAIEEEGAAARGVALREIAWLLPALLAGGAAYALVAAVPGAAAAWTGLCSAAWPSGQHFPVAGVVFAMHGAIVGAAAGWAVRILFTLVFGREAFGVGDIFILAAAGACGGWDIALLGFLLSIGIALLSWMISLLLKRSVMIAFGPPLAIGFVAALALHRPATALFAEYFAAVRQTWTAHPQTLYLFAGVLLVGFVASVILARLIRRAIEPRA
jgi:leader peptidase (prepilin peptidase) / N-methyltransferase